MEFTTESKEKIRNIERVHTPNDANPDSYSYQFEAWIDSEWKPFGPVVTATHSWHRRRRGHVLEIGFGELDRLYAQQPPKRAVTQYEAGWNDSQHALETCTSGAQTVKYLHDMSKAAPPFYQMSEYQRGAAECVMRALETGKIPERKGERPNG
jgi:hypothetical protein